MPRVVFEPTIPVLERAKNVYVLDRAATVTGYVVLDLSIFLHFFVTFTNGLTLFTRCTLSYMRFVPQHSDNKLLNYKGKVWRKLYKGEVRN
jgi:hypothetical protein